MKYTTIFILILAFATAFTACHSHEDGDGHSHGEAADEHSHGGDSHETASTITLTAEQIKSVKVQLGDIEQKQLTSSLKLNGVLKVPNENMAQVTSMYQGVVKALHVQAGNYVKKGQTIATVANPQYLQVQEEYLTLLGKIAFSEQEETRQKELQSGNAGALKNLQAAQAELRTMRTRKASLAKQLQLMGIDPAKVSDNNLITSLTVSSPITGVVSRIMVNIGSSVDFASPIAEVVDNSQLHLDLFVFEKDLPKLRVGQTIHFTLTNNPGKEYDAQIYGIGSTFEPNTKNVAVHARVQGNKGELIDGMNITALVSLEKATLDAVPSEAIVNHEGQDYIFAVSTEKSGEDGSLTFEKIPVRKGTTDVGYSEVALLKDVPKEAKIVTGGAFFVLAKLTNQGEAHQH